MEEKQQAYKSLKMRQQKELARSLLRKWYMIDDVIGYYIAQLASTERLIDDTEGLLDKIEAPYRQALAGSLEERYKALTEIVQSLLRWKSAIDNCELHEMTPAEQEVFVDRYVKRKLWKMIRPEHYDGQKKLSINRDILYKVANAITRADAEAQQALDKQKK